jgi:outer membrane protein
MKRTMRLAVPVFIFAAGAVWPQAPVRLTLNECVARGLASNRALESAALDRDAARAAATGTWMLYLPSLAVTGSYTRASPQAAYAIQPSPLLPPVYLTTSLEDNWLVRVELKENVFTGFKVKSAVDAAEAAAAVQTAAWETERENAVYSIQVAYRQLQQALEADALTGELVAAVRARVEEVKKQRAQGLATANDELKAESDLSSAEMQKIDAQSAVRLARARLNLLIGLPLENETVTEEFAPAAASVVAALDEALSAAYGRRSELVMAEGQVKAGEAGVASAAAAFYPALLLRGNYTYANPNPNVFPRSAEWQGTWEIGAAVSVDLGAYPQAVFKTEEARLRLDRARSRYNEIRDNIALEVLAAALDLERCGQRLAAAGKLLAQAAENLRVTTDKNRNGLAITSDVLDARIAFLTATLANVRAGYDCEIARLTFLRRQGLSWQSTAP